MYTYNLAYNTADLSSWPVSVQSVEVKNFLNTEELADEMFAALAPRSNASI